MRPRRQPAQKSWKQSSRQGCSYRARHSGHTSGGPLAASRAPGPSRGAKIAPDIFGHSAGGRGGARGPSAPAPPPSYLARWTTGRVQRSWSGGQRGSGAGGWSAGRGENGQEARGGARPCAAALPASPRQPWKVSRCLLPNAQPPRASPLPSPPPQEFSSRCPLGDPQPTPLPRQAPPASRAVAPSTFPRPAPAASRRKPGRISALAAAVTQGSGYGHGRGHCSPGPEEERRQRAVGKDPAGQGFEVRTGPCPR